MRSLPVLNQNETKQKPVNEELERGKFVQRSSIPFIRPAYWGDIVLTYWGHILWIVRACDVLLTGSQVRGEDND
jgi:hypothetical protein